MFCGPSTTPHSARSSSTTDPEHVLKSSLRWQIDESVTEDIRSSRTEVEAGSAPRDEAPARRKRISRREGDTRLGQAPSTESIEIRGYRFPNGEACRLSWNHPCIRVRDCDYYSSLTPLDHRDDWLYRISLTAPVAYQIISPSLL